MRARFGRALAGGLLAVLAVGGAGGWAAADGQRAVTGPPPGSAAWVADATLGLRLPEPGRADAAEVAAFFAGLPQAQQRALAVRHPLVVGNLDGAPFALRYFANALALREERDRELAVAADGTLPERDRAAARGKADRYAALTGRQLLAFDPRGRGQLAEVFGDLARAKRTAVIVPGADIDLMTVDRTSSPYGTPTGMARALRDRAGDRLAVVAWTGYTTPVKVGLDAATARLARAGAPRLSHFLSGLAPTTGPVTVLCHSYGTAVCSLADLGPEQATGIVAIGSPGMDVDRAADLRVPVWVAQRNAEDWIDQVPNVSFLGLGHGADPEDPAFGARTVASAGSHGHSGYFAPGTASLANFAAIALGRTDQVTCAPGRDACTR
ncbi:alpha/beta hydrolase family protein [Kitasatospora sp. NBC_00070]|uniref:alpha/beta hydrolase n=1 Tax=Kitasatospora sp. NBC_00070 TaxID=2975962 RepID=UPI00324DC621